MSELEVLYRQRLLDNIQADVGKNNRDGHYGHTLMRAGDNDSWCAVSNAYWRGMTTNQLLGIQGAPVVESRGALDEAVQAEKLGAFHVGNVSEAKPGDSIVLNYGKGHGHIFTVESIDVKNGVINGIGGNDHHHLVGRQQYSLHDPRIYGYIDEGRVLKGALARYIAPDREITLAEAQPTPSSTSLASLNKIAEAGKVDRRHN